MPVIAEYVRTYQGGSVGYSLQRALRQSCGGGDRNWRCEIGEKLEIEYAGGAAAGHRCSVIWSRRRAILRGVRSHGRPEDLSAPSMHRLFASAVRQTTGFSKSEHGRHVASNWRPRFWSTMPDAMEAAVMQHLGIAILPEMERGCRPCRRRPAWRICFPTSRLPPCRYMPSIPRRTGCSLRGSKLFWTC